jgi:hypothetical protein
VLREFWCDQGLSGTGDAIAWVRSLSGTSLLGGLQKTHNTNFDRTIPYRSDKEKDQSALDRIRLEILVKELMFWGLWRQPR